MEIKILKDKQFIQNQILQRTGIFIELGGRMEFVEWVESGNKNQLTHFLEKNNFKDLYFKKLVIEIVNEVKALKKCLIHTPDKKYNLLSIGCGTGIYELILQYFIDCETITLFDTESSPGIHRHNFSNNLAASYTILDQTKLLFKENNYDIENLTVCNPDKEKLPTNKFNLIISILSMGFHYPCDQYASYIENILDDEGVFVLDKRRETIDHGYDYLKKRFRMFNKINFKKHDRFFFKK